MNTAAIEGIADALIAAFDDAVEMESLEFVEAAARRIAERFEVEAAASAEALRRRLWRALLLVFALARSPLPQLEEVATVDHTAHLFTVEGLVIQQSRRQQIELITPLSAGHDSFSRRSAAQRGSRVCSSAASEISRRGTPGPGQCSPQ